MQIEVEHSFVVDVSLNNQITDDIRAWFLDAKPDNYKVISGHYTNLVRVVIRNDQDLALMFYLAWGNRIMNKSELHMP